MVSSFCCISSPVLVLDGIGVNPAVSVVASGSRVTRVTSSERPDMSMFSTGGEVKVGSVMDQTGKFQM